jgi:rRNA maturation RNase YbeY
VRAQAIERDHTEYEESLRLIVHGIFHILGYDHEQDSDYLEMAALEYTVIGGLQSKYSLLLDETNPSIQEHA